ncbi:primosomal protein N' [Radicibacter daui]|uniref:primosomal protein N' n=1 Tax=Radicibacter daui TaxID=3064829 RepID=UPI0040470521
MPSRNTPQDAAQSLLLPELAQKDAVRLAAVLLPLPLAGPYHYSVPEGLDLAPGDIVEVPLGQRRLIGVVWSLGGEPPQGTKLKSVLGLMPVPPMGEVLRRFVDWVAAYTLSAPGAVLRMALSVPAALEEPKTVTAYLPVEGMDFESLPRLTPARARVLRTLEGMPPLTPAEIAREAGVSAGVVRGLIDARLLQPVELSPRALGGRLDPTFTTPGFSPDQQAAAKLLRRAVAAHAYSATVLDGVTGSGKTEVYLEAVAEVLEGEGQVLVLVPEIALTPQMTERFSRRFGAAPLIWHSELTQAQRRTGWRSVAEGRSRVVVGARSALFLPFADLRLIIVDEEHEASFKQEDGVAYNGRDMAVVRAHLGAIPVVLVSATPSLESVVNADGGRYARVHLPERHGGAELPEISLVDLRADKPERHQFLSTALRDALKETVAAGDQAMLFLNRRGYAPLTLCRACGHRIQCPHCTAWLVEHRFRKRLQCHHCGYSTPLPEHCPSCGEADSLVACGPGVERVAEEVAALLPEARVLEMSSDTMTGPTAIAEAVGRIRRQETDVIIGTQLVAKGHHFPHLTLVGVVDGDVGLGGGDLRAAERTYQMLHQVAGRAGRAHKPGRVLIQTWQADHPVMQALADGERDEFVERELQERQQAGMPPYGRLAALIISGPDADAVDNLCRRIARSAPQIAEVRVLGPAPAPMALLRGRHRRRFLIKAAKGFALQPLLRDWLGALDVPSNVRLQVDIDPYSFL